MIPVAKQATVMSRENADLDHGCVKEPESREFRPKRLSVRPSFAHQPYRVCVGIKPGLQELPLALTGSGLVAATPARPKLADLPIISSLCRAVFRSKRSSRPRHHAQRKSSRTTSLTVRAGTVMQKVSTTSAMTARTMTTARRRRTTTTTRQQATTTTTATLRLLHTASSACSAIT